MPPKSPPRPLRRNSRRLSGSARYWTLIGPTTLASEATVNKLVTTFWSLVKPVGPSRLCCTQTLGGNKISVLPVFERLR